MSAVRPPVSAVTDDALGEDDLVTLESRLASGDVTPRELWQAARARAEAVEPTLNAVACWVDEPDHVRGVPVVVKDNEDLAGYPTRQGSRTVPASPARQSSPFVAQMLALGLAPVAKTTLPELGLTATTESTLHGPTRNPWRTTHSAGGSSGGSAALVAAGVVPIGHANDGGGSIRIPAACCGLVGLKPSRGRLVDRPELDRLPVPLVTQGVLTRSVRDTAHYLATAERHHRSSYLPPIGDVRGPGPARLRIGLVHRAPHDVPLSHDVLAAVDTVARALDAAGHHVVPIDPPVDEQFGRDFLVYWQLLAFAFYRGGRALVGSGFDAEQAESFTQYLSRRLVRDGPRVPGALRRLRRHATTPEPIFDRVDVVLSPVLAHAAPPLGHLGPGVDPRTHLVRLLQWTAFTPAANVTGGPAVALPASRTDEGLPIGVQLSAPRGHERRLLELGYELEPHLLS
jgi:amidase